MSAPIRIGTADKSSADLGNDGFEIHSDGKTLNIRGGTRGGTGNLFGVYEYLERLGCRFLTKTEEYIPTGKNYELPVLNMREKPSFEFRRITSTGRFGVKMRCNERVGNNGKLLNKLGVLRYSRPFDSHTSFFFIDPKKYAKSHPEYFAIHQGRRAFSKTVGQLCLSNPEMTEEFIRNVKAYLKKTKLTEGAFLKIAPQDDQNYCECARCAEIDKEEGTHGGTLVRFLNRVAEELSKDYPDLPIGGSAYQYYRFPPKKTSYHKNVFISLSNIECDYSKAFTGYPANEEFLNLLLEWKKRCSKLHAGDYGATFDYYQLPLPNFDALAERLRKFRDIGIIGVSTINAHNGGPAGEFNELRNYLTSRLYWNADADPWKIAEDFCCHYYGKGGKYLLDYIRWYHQYLTSKKAVFRIMRQPVTLYDEAFVDRAEQAFRQAYAAAGGDPVIRTRLDRAYTTVQMMRVLLLRRTRPNSPEFKAAVDQLEASSKRFGIRAISESKTSMEDFIREMRFTIKEVPDFCRGKKWYATLPSAHLLWDWAKKVDDPLAASRKAIQLNTWHNAWAVFKNLQQLPGYNTPARYDAYVRIRVVPEPGAKTDSPAFSAGVSLSKGNSLRRIIPLKDTSADEYRYIRIAESIPVTETGYVWVAPEKNPKMIRKILVDHFIFVRVDDAKVNK